jgi:hypothetical protein
MARYAVSAHRGESAVGPRDRVSCPRSPKHPHPGLALEGGDIVVETFGDAGVAEERNAVVEHGRDTGFGTDQTSARGNEGTAYRFPLSSSPGNTYPVTLFWSPYSVMPLCTRRVARA